jgi:hypothetical protein
MRLVHGKGLVKLSWKYLMILCKLVSVQIQSGTREESVCLPSQVDSKVLYNEETDDYRAHTHAF